jgi:hypothetical protein
MSAALEQIERNGRQAVRLEGEGDVADICRLTCLERGMTLDGDLEAPLLRIQGLKIFVEWNGTADHAAPASQPQEREHD